MFYIIPKNQNYYSCLYETDAPLGQSIEGNLINTYDPFKVPYNTMLQATIALDKLFTGPLNIIFFDREVNHYCIVFHEKEMSYYSSLLNVILESASYQIS